MEVIGAINWENRGYIWGETSEFLNEINPPRRRVVIGDAEQLAATSIILEWSHSSILLFPGADNRNVLSWARKGYAKKGSSLVLNQETSKWIADRGAQVEGVYVRSGRNFSPDRMARTTLAKVGQWAERYGFSRVRLKPMRDEMMMDYRSLKLEEVATPEDRSGRSGDQNRLCVEWNGGGSRFVESAHQFGSEVKFSEGRHDRVINQLCQWYKFTPYEVGEIFLLG